MNILGSKLESLIELLTKMPEYVIACSGGVDSMLLSFIACSQTEATVHVAHACSPAVPSDALARIKTYANNYDWRLEILNAGELEDPNYLSNPVNRCYFCKSNLFSRISEKFSNMPILTGTNTDDLSDFRPGLIAASEHNVRQVYVEAGISKQEIYQLAKHFGLLDLHAFPAQPCLASRIETGIGVKAEDLHFIDTVERMAQHQLTPAHTLRCRITAEGVYFEVAESLSQQQLSRLNTDIHTLCSESNRIFAGIREYKKGAAFIHA